MDLSIEYCHQVSLPKYPCLLVLGDKVTAEQAQDICIRTNALGFSCHDPTLWKKYLDIFDVPYKSTPYEYVLADWKASGFGERFLLLELEYLTNARIMSSYFRGPHGWCAWDGTVATSHYSIGKWPAAAEVLDEWRLIAKTFPWLRLRAQLLDTEELRPDTKPLVEYVVQYGEAAARPPARILDVPQTPKLIYLSETEHGSVGEIGISPSDLTKAVAAFKIRHGIAPLPK